MPLEDAKPAQRDAIRNHWFGHLCWPFPAGGLVPRECTLPTPAATENLRERQSDALKAQAQASADFAARLLHLEAKAVEQRAAADKQRRGITRKTPDVRPFAQASVFTAGMVVGDAKAEEGVAPEDVRKGRSTRKTPLSSLLAHASIAWATRHPELTSPDAAAAEGRGATRVNGYHPAMTVLQAWSVLGAGRHPDPQAKVWADVVADFEERFSLRLRPGSILNESPLCMPYAWKPHPARGVTAGKARWAHAFGYGCTCQIGYALPRNPRVGNPRSPAELDPLRSWLRQPSAEWALLAQLFLKALHGHLGWLPDAGEAGEEQRMLHGMVLRLLQRRLYQPGVDAQAGLAHGLASGLQWIYRDAPMPDAWVGVPPGLVDGVPEEPTALARQALRWLSRAALGIDFFESQMPQTLMLARDIASDFTQPSLALETGVTADDWSRLRIHMDGKARKLQEHLSPSAAAKKNGRGRYPPCRIPNARFMLHALLPREKTQATYQGWMGQRGHRLVEALLDTSCEAQA